MLEELDEFGVWSLCHKLLEQQYFAEIHCQKFRVRLIREIFHRILEHSWPDQTILLQPQRLEYFPNVFSDIPRYRGQNRVKPCLHFVLQ